MINETRENPSYYAILTADVRYDKRLKANEKLLFAEITALTQSNGICHASNDYFAELYGVSKVSVSQWISNLVECGYISREIIYKDGSKEILNRYLKLVKHPIKENLNTPIKENLKDNTTRKEQYKNNKEKIYKKENDEIRIESIEKPNYLSDTNWTQFKTWWNLRLKNHKKLRSTQAALDKQLAIIKDLDNKTIANALKMTISGDANAVCYQNIIVPKDTIPIGKSNPHVFDDQDYDNAQKHFRVPINQPPRNRSA